MSEQEKPATTTPPTARGLRGGLRRNSLRIVTGIIATATLIGIVLRLTVQDRFPLLGILYYATPLPVLLCGAVWCLSAAVRKDQRRRGACWGLIVVGLMNTWLHQDWRFSTLQEPPLETAADNLSVVFWNVGRRADLSDAASTIRKLDADVVGLVEVEGDVADRKRFWQNACPGYDVTALGGQMFLLTKGTSGATIVHDLEHGSNSRQLEVTIRGNSYQIFLVDIFAHLLVPRDSALARLAAIVRPYETQRVVILGDFNTPADSRWFGPLREHHVNAFEKAGCGYAATWPVPLPLLQLDQIWMNGNLTPLTCGHEWSWASDHELVWTQIRPSR